MKTLFIKLGAIGDVCMARGLPAEAARLHPHSHFTWVAGRSVAPLVRLFPGVQQVIEVDDAGLLSGGPGSRLKAGLQAWARLALRSYDQVLTGHADGRYSLLSALTLASERRSFGEGPAFAGGYGAASLPLPGRYHGHEYLRLLGADQGPEKARPLPRLKVPLSKDLAAKLKGKGPAALLFPGGAKNLLRDDGLRRWPLGHYAALARLLQQKGWRIWLGGAPSDTWVRPAFKGLKALDLIGAADLCQTLALCAEARCVVTHDSGPLHLAQASGARSVALFGPTVPSEKVDPFSRTEALWGGAELACRPCYDGRDYAPCASNDCLGGLLPGQVLGAVLR